MPNAYRLGLIKSSRCYGRLWCFNDLYICECSFHWRPASVADGLLVHDQSKVSIVNIDDLCKPVSTRDVCSQRAGHIHAATWDPHHRAQCLAVAVESIVKGIDTRQANEAAELVVNRFFNVYIRIYSFDTGHNIVRSMDFNPNRSYILATAGDDSRVRFWDTRNVDRPLHTVHEHSHWLFIYCYA